MEGEAGGREWGGEAVGSWKEEMEETRRECREEGREGKRPEVKGMEWIRVLREERDKELAAERSSSVVAKVESGAAELVPEVDEMVAGRRLEDFFFIIIFFFPRSSLLRSFRVSL